ncbi:MAG: 3-deoxy-D-manno-octulosonic acid transferase, partial [Tardiphaga sp.]|nr:3-deoxy-D-manno-octulosonic acid transferase [Tardiphaga sp.]
INGRMSQRSFPRWQRMHGTISALLGRFETCLVQSDTDAERFAALGGRNIVNTGNLKLDVPAPPVDDLRLQMLKTAMRGRPIVIAASTHPGEDEIIIAAHRILLNYFPKLLTVIVPRHSARGEDIAALVSASGAKAALRSRGEMPDDTIGFYIGDTMGEMGLFFRLSPVVVMGGSLVPHGGQNPIEAIKLGAAIVHGPQVFNFTEVFAALDAAGGAKQVTDAETLAKQLGQWLANDEARQSCIDAGTAVVDHLGGALDRTMAALTPYLVQLRLELHADA